MELEDMFDRLHLQEHFPIRAFAIQKNGVIQVIESERTENAEIIHTWGDQSSSSVLAASLTNRFEDPLLAVARRNYEINVLDPRDGSPVFWKACDPNHTIVGLHVFNNHTSEQDSTRSCKLFTCSQQGQVEINHYTLERSCNILGAEPIAGSNWKWSVAENCSLSFSKLHEMEDFSMFGGENAALYKCNLETGQNVWTAGRSDGWPRDLSFLSGSFVPGAHNLLVVGSSNHNVYLFDTRQQRPSKVFDFYLEKPGELESPIQAIVQGLNREMYVGTDSGDLFTLNLETGGRDFFQGIGRTAIRHENMYSQYPRVACSGPIRALAKHDHYPLIASAGDYCLDIWKTVDRSLNTKVFMDENLSHILFDYTSFNKADQSQHEGPSEESFNKADQSQHEGPSEDKGFGKVYGRRANKQQRPNRWISSLD